MSTRVTRAGTRPPKKTAAAAGLAAAFAVMTAIAVPQWETWEGTEHVAYRDIVGVLTICSGDTRNVAPGQVASEQECRDRTAKIMMEYGGAVREASPGIENSPYEWAAHTTFTGNVGKAGYRRSSARRLFVAGRRVQACRALRLWNKAGGRVVKGLVFRREGEGDRIGEYEMCLAGAVPADLGYPVVRLRAEAMMNATREAAVKALGG